MESLLNACLRRFGAPGWAALLPVVMLVCMVYWGVRPWTWAMTLGAGAIALLAPAVAADGLPRWFPRPGLARTVVVVVAGVLG